MDRGGSTKIVISLEKFIGQVYPVNNTTATGIDDGLDTKDIGTVEYKLK